MPDMFPKNDFILDYTVHRSHEKQVKGECFSIQSAGLCREQGLCQAYYVLVFLGN